MTPRERYDSDNDQLLEEVHRFRSWFKDYDGTVSREAELELIKLRDAIGVRLWKTKRSRNNANT